MTNLLRIYLAVLAIGALLLTLVLVTVPASAGLMVSGAIAKGDAVSGTTYTHTMTIGTRDTDPPMDILVDVKGLRQTLDGATQALDAADDTSPYSARGFIILDKSSFHLEPGASQTVVATLNIPANVGSGGRYAVIYIHNQPVGSGRVGIVSGINVPVYLTIKGSQLFQTGKITGPPTAEAVSGEPVDILSNFQNTGNVDFKVKGEVTIKDPQGKTLTTLSIPVTSSSVLPNLIRQLQATFIPQVTLPLGRYVVQSKVMLEDGNLLDQATGNFEVKAPYVPPPPAASITLTLGNSATLATDDGRISIAFTQGSVTGETKVSLQSYSPSQLPAPQSGITLGTTCFRVDGLTGLLVKNANITVKYSSADLDKLGSDASRLELARYDEGQSAWTVLKTNVDMQAMVLSAETNQFSIWAVAVGGAVGSAPGSISPVVGGTAGVASPRKGVNSGLIIGILAGVVIIALLIYFLVVRRRVLNK